MIAIWKRARKAAARTYGHELADDIAQEVILSYLVYEKKHGKPSKQTIDQAVVDAYRNITGTRHIRPVLISFEEHHVDQPYDNQPPEYEELRLILDARLHRLTKRQLQCVTLILSGLKQREAAKELGISESGVALLMKYIVRNLK